MVKSALALGLLWLSACAHPRKQPLLEENPLQPVTVLPATPALSEEVYVPVYSRLVYSEGRGGVELSALLTIRNTDAKAPIIVESVRYFDSTGKLLRDEVACPSALGPLATAMFLLKRSDEAGGAGASYVVRWRSSQEVTEPLIEAVMADLSTSHSVAFTSRGLVTQRQRGAALPP